MAKYKRRLLIIDDDEINNFILVRMIKKKKIPIACKTALNGKKGLKNLQNGIRKGVTTFPISFCWISTCLL